MLTHSQGDWWIYMQSSRIDRMSHGFASAKTTVAVHIPMAQRQQNLF